MWPAASGLSVVGLGVKFSLVGNILSTLAAHNKASGAAAAATTTAAAAAAAAMTSLSQQRTMER